MGEHKFKAGDKVIAKRTYEGTDEGEIYTIAGYACATEIGEWVYLSELRNNASDDGSFLEKNFEPVAVADSNGNRFKVGDRVKITADEDGRGGGKFGTVVDIVADNLAEIDVDAPFDGWGENSRHWNVSLSKLQAPLTIQSGKFYRTRDGRKVGPMKEWKHSDAGYQWESEGYLWKDDGENHDKGSVHTIIAEWTDDEPVLDTSTTGFTVPLEAPEFGGAEGKFKVGDRVEHINLKGTGVGVIEDVFDNGTVSVRWSSWHGCCTDPVDALRLVAEATTAQEPPTTIADIVRRLERLESAMCRRAA